MPHRFEQPSRLLGSRRKREGGKIIFDVPPTTLELVPCDSGRAVAPLPPLPFPRRQSNAAYTLKPPLPRPLSFHDSIWWRFERKGNIIEVPWIRFNYRQRDDLEGDSARDKPVMSRWAIELQEHPEPRSPPQLWGTDLPWFCKPTTTCEPYAVAGKRLGFKLTDGRPVSTYAAERRVRPPRGIEDDDAWLVEVHLEAGEEREDVWKVGLHTRVQRDNGTVVYGEVLASEAIEMEVEGVEVGSDPLLARDMGTRYAWQVARDIPYSRDYSGMMDNVRKMEWGAFFNYQGVVDMFRSLRAPVRPAGRPKKGESRSGLIKDWEDVLQLLIASRQLKRLGYPKEERHRRLAAERKTSPAQVKRYLDAILRQLKAALAGPDIRNRK